MGSTARLTTGAALIIVVVFAGFATGELVAFQQMGFGVAAALLIDATIVRSVVIPAAMSLLGDRNWYLPGWLSRLPDVQIEGPAAPEMAVEPERGEMPRGKRARRGRESSQVLTALAGPPPWRASSRSRCHPVGWAGATSKLNIIPLS